MAKYYTVSELSLMTGLHRQTIYNKVREAFNAGSELVKRPTVSDGWLAQKGLFTKYIVEKNSEEVEAIAPDVIQLSERVYEDLVKERDTLKEEVKALYERVLNSERLSAKYEALYSHTEAKQLEVTNDPLERPINNPIGTNSKSIYENSESSLKGVKTPSYDMSDNVFYAVLISIAILGAVGLYIAEVL